MSTFYCFLFYQSTWLIFISYSSSPLDRFSPFVLNFQLSRLDQETKNTLCRLWNMRRCASRHAWAVLDRYYTELLGSNRYDHGELDTHISERPGRSCLSPPQHSKLREKLRELRFSFLDPRLVTMRSAAWAQLINISDIATRSLIAIFSFQVYSYLFFADLKFLPSARLCVVLSRAGRSKRIWYHEYFEFMHTGCQRWEFFYVKRTWE